MALYNELDHTGTVREVHTATMADGDVRDSDLTPSLGTSPAIDMSEPDIAPSRVRRFQRSHRRVSIKKSMNRDGYVSTYSK